VNKQKKSHMKELFRNAGVQVAQGKIVHSEEEIKAFGNAVGYPLCAKPNSGVGGIGAVRLKSENDIKALCDSREFASKEYVVEEYIHGKIVTFDGLVDLNGNIVFYSSFEVNKNIMEAMESQDDLSYYIHRTVPPDLVEQGTKVVKEFNIRSGEFYHIEFFRRSSDNSLVGLEVNMRPPGGNTVDMWNFAFSTDLYAAWANIVLRNTFTPQIINSALHYCCFASRRKEIKYAHTHEEVSNKYRNILAINDPMPSVWAGSMGDWIYIFKVQEKEKMLEVLRFIQHKADPAEVKEQ